MITSSIRTVAVIRRAAVEDCARNTPQAEISDTHDIEMLDWKSVNGAETGV